MAGEAKTPYRPSFRRRMRAWRAWVRYRRWRMRCTECGMAFLPTHAVFGYGNAREHFHDKCMGYRNFRYAADERLEVLDLVTEVWGITMGDVTELMAGRAEREGYQSSNAWNKGWRVMHAIDQRREAAQNPPSQHT